MEDLQISFSWIYPSVKNGNCVAYCFAYVRDPKTYNTLYAGVKYEGGINELTDFRPKLRRTAIERLVTKPIFATFSLGDDESYKNIINDRKHRFNGITAGNIEREVTKPKKSVSLAKFFLYCAVNQKFSDLGLFSSKTDADLKLLVDGENVEIYKNGGKGYLLSVSYGYEYKGNELHRITGSLTEIVINLRKRCKFYGKGKERRGLNDYYELSDEYLEQFGFTREDKKKPNPKIVLTDYQKDQRVIYYRMALSKKTRAHIALMQIGKWQEYVSETVRQPLIINFDSEDENVYCMAYSLEKTSRRGTKQENKWKRDLHRLIAINRLIESPNIVETEFFDEMDLKDIRMWFGRRITFFPERGEKRFKYDGCEMEFYAEKFTLDFDRYSERIYLYYLDNSWKMPKFLENIFRFFGLV